MFFFCSSVIKKMEPIFHSLNDISKDSCVKMYEVFLIRHGESQSNAGEPTSDPENVVLTLRGREEAACVTKYFLQKEISLDLIITSSYRRASETAEATQEYFPSASVELSRDVREFTYLLSMHHKVSTVKERRPQVEDYWNRLDPTYKDVPGSESFESFITRVRRFIVRLRKENRGNIAAFSHEQFITALLWLLDRRPSCISPQAMDDYRGYFQRNRIPNGGIVRIRVCPEQPSWEHELIKKHLKERVTGPLNVLAGAAVGEYQTALV
jgi:broad specificity phosphatase PhoE